MKHRIDGNSEKPHWILETNESDKTESDLRRVLASLIDCLLKCCLGVGMYKLSIWIWTMKAIVACGVSPFFKWNMQIAACALCVVGILRFVVDGIRACFKVRRR
jgi:hypothetical protein